MYSLVKILGGSVNYLLQDVESNQVLVALRKLEVDAYHYVVTNNRVESISQFLLRALGASMAPNPN